MHYQLGNVVPSSTPRINPKLALAIVSVTVREARQTKAVELLREDRDGDVDHACAFKRKYVQSFVPRLEPCASVERHIGVRCLELEQLAPRVVTGRLQLVDDLRERCFVIPRHVWREPTDHQLFDAPCVPEAQVHDSRFVVNLFQERRMDDRGYVERRVVDLHRHADLEDAVVYNVGHRNCRSAERHTCATIETACLRTKLSTASCAYAMRMDCLVCVCYVLVCGVRVM